RKKRRAEVIEDGLARLKSRLPAPTPPLQPPSTPVEPATEPRVVAPEPPSPPPEPPPPPASGAQRIAGIAVGSAGIASLAVAGGLAGAAFLKFAQSSPYCTP